MSTHVGTKRESLCGSCFVFFSFSEDRSAAWYIPGTCLTCVSIGNNHILGGLWSKTEVRLRFQVGSYQSHGVEIVRFAALVFFRVSSQDGRGQDRKGRPEFFMPNSWVRSDSGDNSRVNFPGSPGILELMPAQACS